MALMKDDGSHTFEVNGEPTRKSTEKKHRTQWKHNTIQWPTLSTQAIRDASDVSTFYDRLLVIAVTLHLTAKAASGTLHVSGAWGTTKSVKVEIAAGDNGRKAVSVLLGATGVK